MFEIMFIFLLAFAIISAILCAMEENHCSKGLISGASWVGYGCLAFGFFVAAMSLFA